MYFLHCDPSATLDETPSVSQQWFWGQKTWSMIFSIPTESSRTSSMNLYWRFFSYRLISTEKNLRRSSVSCDFGLFFAVRSLCISNLFGQLMPEKFPLRGGQLKIRISKTDSNSVKFSKPQTVEPLAGSSSEFEVQRQVTAREWKLELEVVINRECKRIEMSGKLLLNFF